MIYFIILFLGLIFSFINSDLRKNKIYMQIYALILTVLAIFRYGIGPDYFPYKYLYSRLNVNVINEVFEGIDKQEILFRVFGSLMKGIGFSYQMYLVIFSVLHIYILVKICSQYSENPLLSLVLYFSFYYIVWTMSGIRQGTTIILGAYLILHELDNTFNYKYILGFIVLSFIHTSSLILIPMYILTKFEISKKQIFAIIIISILVSFIPLKNIVENFNSYPIFDRISPYISIENNIYNFFSFKNLGRLFFIGVALIHYDRFAILGISRKKLINIYLISICIYFFFKFSELTAARLSIYGKFFDIILISNFYDLYKDKWKKMTYAILVVTLCSIYTYKESTAMKYQIGISNDDSYFVPYINIFNKDNFKFNTNYFELLDE